MPELLRRNLSSRRRFRDYLADFRRRVGRRRTRPSELPPGRRPRQRSSLQLLRAFAGMLGESRGAMVFALATLTISTILSLVPPATTKLVIDHVLSDVPLPTWLARLAPFATDRWKLLLAFCGAAVLISAVQIFLRVVSRWKATQVTKRVQLALRRRLFEHAVRLPLHRVYELKSGGVASLLREDAGSVGDLVFGMLFNPWRAIIQLAGGLCVLAWVDWRMLVATLVLIPIVFFTHGAWNNLIRPIHRDIRNRRQEIDAAATETFGGMRVVRAFSRQRSEALRFTGANHYMARQEMLAWWCSRFVEGIWSAIIPLASTGLMLYGGWQVLEGRMTVGDLMMFLVYLVMLLEPMGVLAETMTSLQNGLSALDRVLDVLAEPREMLFTGPPAPTRRPETAARVTLDRVSFRYPGVEGYALEDISLDVAPGQTVALAGPSGAGKTTLCNLIARFYDATSGRVLLDGRDIREIDVESYRTLLGIVEQDVFLFDGTIAENIAFADRHATEERIVQAAEAAHAAEFIRRLPDGFATVIGERGVKLSGGQRQRLAIARAILADPRILILDEATSNLDTESERLIQVSLAGLMRNRTSFVIAHRLSTIVHADRILVLEHGRIVEQGTHAELMAADRRYRSMVEMQFQHG